MLKRLLTNTGVWMTIIGLLGMIFNNLGWLGIAELFQSEEMKQVITQIINIIGGGIAAAGTAVAAETVPDK